MSEGAMLIQDVGSAVGQETRPMRMRKKAASTLVVSVSAAISLLGGLNIWFVNRLVQTIDDSSRRIESLQTQVSELRGEVAVLKYAIERNQRGKNG